MTTFAIVKRAITMEREIKERSKEIVIKIKKRRLRVITLHDQYWKKKKYWIVQ